MGEGGGAGGLTHRAALLVALSGEIWTEEQVCDGQQQRFSQRPSFIVILVFIQTLEDKETSHFCGFDITETDF